MERHPGGLGKRGPRLEQSGAVHPWSGFKHLRFATPARRPLHDSYGGAFGRVHGPARAGRGDGAGSPGWPCALQGSAEATTCPKAIVLLERRAMMLVPAASGMRGRARPAHEAESIAVTRPEGGIE